MLDLSAARGQIPVMVAYPEPGQRITRLTPLADALSAVEALAGPVEPREAVTAAARGCTLAADAVVPAALPAVALALRDGWAVRSGETTDAGSYAPAPLSMLPVRMTVGEPMPPGADAVMPLETVVFRGQIAEALIPVAPGEGVLPAGADVQAGKPLRQTGERLRALDQAALSAAGIARVSIREPRIRLVRAHASGGAAIAAGYEWLAQALATEGAAVIRDEGDAAAANNLEAALLEQTNDAVVVLGGTGSGGDDASIATLAKTGRVAFHGVGLVPGETAGFGAVGARPVLLVPGRIDAALAVWLVVGRPLLARLAARRDEETAVMARLARKVTSRLGMAELIAVRRSGDKIEPLASGYLSLSALAHADGWILVPAASEGYPAGAQVAVRPLA